MSEERRDNARVAGWFYRHLCDDWLYPLVGETLRLGDDVFDVQYQDEDNDDPDSPTLIRRQRDGAVFEIDVQVFAELVRERVS